MNLSERWIEYFPYALAFLAALFEFPAKSIGQSVRSRFQNQGIAQLVEKALLAGEAVVVIVLTMSFAVTHAILGSLHGPCTYPAALAAGVTGYFIVLLMTIWFLIAEGLFGPGTNKFFWLSWRQVLILSVAISVVSGGLLESACRTPHSSVSLDRNVEKGSTSPTPTSKPPI
jgi:small-conductance mechanosensitive channel